MDKNVICENADKIWTALNRQANEISIPELAQIVNLSIESTTLAIGWLACENKVGVERKNGAIEIYNENHYPLYFG